MRTHHHIVWAATSLAALFTVSSMLTAGPLTPPPGPVAPTPEIEPRTAVNTANTPGDADATFQITQPGSYYLTGNITGEPAKSGVVILAGGVTLDLMGFELLGDVGSLDGVTIVGSVSGVRIHNGLARGWGRSGVNALAASSAVLRDLVVSDNGAHGLRTGPGSLVEGCVARSNGIDGFVIDTGSTISGCTASSNTGDGIVTGSGSTVNACTASFNGSDGIFASSSNTVSGCTARSNGNIGIIAATGGSTVSGCTARNNGADGINAATGSTVSGCTAAANTGDGIEVASDVLVVGNVCDNNGVGAGNGAGVHATGLDTRVEGNTVTDNDRGIDIDSSGNLIIRNSASGNSVNYDIVANNKVGLIVSAPNSVAISGSTGGAGVGTTRAWANISF